MKLPYFLLVPMLCLATLLPAVAQNQTVPGTGNQTAIDLSGRSPMVQSAFRFLIEQARRIDNSELQEETLDAISNPNTCVHHRAGLTDADKDRLVQSLISAGLVNPADGASIPGGLKAGIFPPVLNDGSACPHLPQRFFSAPGSVTGGHHSYPGGLPIHESNNDVADVDLANEYRKVYGHTFGEFATVSPFPFTGFLNSNDSAIFIDEDIILGAPLWHDWAKSIVFQWNSDGTEFIELNFGGAGVNDNNGAPGDSRTGGHHILSVAEAMKRGFSPAFVITQASAHSAPTSGNEFKVVNWLRAAAILAQIDPVQKGFLTMDAQGNFRLPALRKLGSIDLINATPSQTNLLAEYTLHNLSDADFTYSGPAVATDQIILQKLAPEFGFNPADTANYNNHFRNPVLSFTTAERLLIIYSEQGLDGVRRQLQELREHHVI
ncbi:MAG TPA: hypothetical protein VKZ53_01765 [Candidatus Angelobacter sp.]|nr:hypothetical protein [Candidatus Angelobacter sp.]